MSSAPSSEKPSQDRDQETSRVLHTKTLSSPHGYVHLELASDGPQEIQLDNILAKSYFTAALKQYLGLMGEAMRIDILKTTKEACWVRLPKEDLLSFCAAVTAYGGVTEGNTRYILRVQTCSDWLGPLTDDRWQDSPE
ncbi:uncharacterized protein MAM_07547 [Metarhizium album ARSEF 1941]|uniref:Ribonucleases P/MRP subunit Pop8-like domain-containing protein n=1 Tax=Metarhizium album (strain ARSEF 1941) TaxID=1081103 RepID=A0A0B2WFE0_METAS|nr:uncharacterized protein MAM_07547 [Metarhizium album ARSEF 1941]KHN94641.1 hypothetical protein MAM_07547 [Metarhizium album ARSEF 1941]